MFTFARLRLALLLGRSRRTSSAVILVCTSEHEDANGPIADQTSRANVAPINRPSKSPATQFQRVSLSDNRLSSPVALDSLAIPFSSRAPCTGVPKNLLTGKDLKTDFGFVNNKNIDGQLKKVMYGVDELGNIVANSAHFYGWMIVSKQAGSGGDKDRDRKT
ncbi:hypothetical protein VP01_5765g2 [Puccinia sorghi]|uniref:Uncharacterized protein n=1 Tax=Puccinia sorghi TaxID=27349 RepID=A0A0L6UIG3_9BASI|nr:hypothetical protein VP01_5765g2 [Puccinia sorghi]